jgi:hypothetical protein
MNSSNSFIKQLEVLQSDTFLRITWFISAIGFIMLFTFSLSKFNKLKPNIRYSMILASLFLFVTAISTSNVMLKYYSGGTQASTDYAPHNVVINQTSADGVTISWVTDREVIGYIRYKTTDVPAQIVMPNRNNQASTATIDHEVTIHNLKKDLTYTFEIIQHGEHYSTFEGKQLQFTLH